MDKSNQQIDEEALNNFTKKLKDKLTESREKGREGWHDPERCSTLFLAELLINNLNKSNEGNFEDIALLAMMLSEREADPRVLKLALQESHQKYTIDYLTVFASRYEYNMQYPEFCMRRTIEGEAEQIKTELSDKGNTNNDGQV